MQPWTPVEEPMTFTAFTEYLFANGIFRFRIPMLFAISGYLFALHDGKPHGTRIRKRLRTLLLPYFIWSIIGLLTAVLLTQWNVTRDVVYNTHLQPADKPFNAYTLPNWISAVLWPTAFQLWFLRCLFIYNLLYPLLLKGVIKFPKIIFTVFTILWLATFGLILFEGEGLLFFTVGIWLCKTQKDIHHTPTWINLSLLTVIFIGAAILKTWLAFHTEGQGLHVFLTITLLHKIVVITGLVVVWFGCDTLVKYFMDKKWFISLTAFSFIIYALHVPLVSYMIDPAFMLLSRLPYYRLITFIMLPLIIMVFCIMVGWLLRKWVPKFYGLLTGGRGF
jgi:fucose 4-O-acetylase-like acetyltransferase